MIWYKVFYLWHCAITRICGVDGFCKYMEIFGWKTIFDQYCNGKRVIRMQDGIGNEIKLKFTLGGNK